MTSFAEPRGADPRRLPLLDPRQRLTRGSASRVYRRFVQVGEPVELHTPEQLRAMDALDVEQLPPGLTVFDSNHAKRRTADFGRGQAVALPSLSQARAAA